MQRIGFVIIPQFQNMYFAAMTVFEVANFSAGRQLYEIELLSEHGGMVSSSIGIRTETLPFGDPTYDTLLIGGGTASVTASPGLVDFVQRAQPLCRRIGSICTGAFILAQAGLLDGKRATTHWGSARELKERYPKVRMEEDRIFIIDGAVWTSAGMSACIDLALGMVEKDFGRDLAHSVAQKLVVYHRRAGGQSQHSELLQMDARTDRIQNALDYARRNLKAPLTVGELADAAHLSPRQFSRAFRSETGQSPARAVENLRLEAARLLMEQSRHPVEFVAEETGFVDPERMRRAFVRVYGQPPQSIRREARDHHDTAASPHSATNVPEGPVTPIVT
ncbi:GlxA family transcriptional regulator [Sphingomonas faeni]|uniref:GlxA family transcriptional regulator n=1 Tax=Sphingomonas faeni TaxID=185950 RepID=UPI00334D6E4D